MEDGSRPRADPGVDPDNGTVPGTLWDLVDGFLLVSKKRGLLGLGGGIRSTEPLSTSTEQNHIQKKLIQCIWPFWKLGFKTGKEWRRKEMNHQLFRQTIYCFINTFYSDCQNIILVLKHEDFIFVISDNKWRVWTGRRKKFKYVTLAHHFKRLW